MALGQRRVEAVPDLVHLALADPGRGPPGVEPVVAPGAPSQSGGPPTHPLPGHGFGVLPHRTTAGRARIGTAERRNTGVLAGTPGPGRPGGRARTDSRA